LVAGNPPFRGAHPMEVLGLIVNVPAPRLSESVPSGSVPQELDRVCAKCLEKKPEDRFRSAGDLAAALSACLEDRRRFHPSNHNRRQTPRVNLVIARVCALGGVLFELRSRSIIADSAGRLSTRVPVVAVMKPEALGKEEDTVPLAEGLQDELV